VKPNKPYEGSGSRIFAKLQGLSIVGNSVTFDPQASAAVGPASINKKDDAPVAQEQVKKVVERVDQVEQMSRGANTEVINLRRKVDRLQNAIVTTTPSMVGPAGRDGVDGKNGRDGKDGKDGKDGAPGLPGQPGEPGIPNATRRTITICTANGAKEIEVFVPIDSY
jgi:hypothetical protein